MFCIKCGASMQAEEKFCPQCGAAVMPVGGQQPAPEYQAFRMPEAVVLLKRLGSSPLFLVPVIAMTLAAVLSFIATVFGSSGIMGVIYQVLNILSEIMPAAVMGELYDALFEMNGALTGVSVVSAIFSMIPTILIVVGLWMIAASAMNKVGAVQTSGFTLLKAMNIIEIVLKSISIFFVEIVLLVLAIVIGNIPSRYFDGSTVVVILVLAMILVLAIFALVVIYYVKVIKSLNAVKSVAAFGYPNPYASRYVGVLCFIGGVGTGISVVVKLIQQMVGFRFMTAGFLFGILSTVCSATALICFGVLIFKYRSTMQQLTYQQVPVQPPVE